MMTFAKSGPNLKHSQTCEVCGAEAHFGFDVRLREAIEAKDAKRAGTWLCAEHRDQSRHHNDRTQAA